MNSLLKRMSAALLALLIVISLLPVSISAAGTITTTPTGYTKASDVVYNTSGKYTANWGARGETCVFLSTYAQAFYTGSYTFDKMSTLTGGSSQSNASQSALYSSLQTLMKSKHTYQTSYDATKQMYAYTDCVRNDTSKLSSFYSGTMVNSSWSSGGTTWNREHTWPQSKGLDGRDEDDIMMLRPTVPSENGSRGNKAYGESSGYFEPGVSNRGDVARIALYVYVRWGNTSYMWGTSGVIENLSILLKWMEEDPVDTWEMGRNDAVQSITGTRNVFVDYPEYAWLLFGRDVPEGITTPSDNDGVTANPGGSTNNGGSSTSTNYTQLSSLSDGDKIVIVNPGSKMALSTTKTGYYNNGISVSGGFGDITSSEIFTAKKNSDGTWSFTSADGKKLALAAEYNSLNETGANDKWELSSAGTNQFYLKNVGRNVYLDWFAEKGNWSTYKGDNLTADFVLAFYKEASSGSNPGGSTITTQPATQPVTQPTTAATTPPTSQPDASESTSVPETQVTTPFSSTPAPMATSSVNPPVLKTENNDDTTIIIVIVAIVVALAAGGIIVFLVVSKRKKISAPAAEDTPEETE